MDRNYSRKLANETLLSKKERDYLTKPKIKYDRGDKSEFLKNLSIRYRNLVNDLRKIQDDDRKKKILSNWKLKNCYEFQYYFAENIFWKSFGKWKVFPDKIYPAKIHREIRGRKKISFYRIEIKKIDNLSANELNKALDPEFLFTEIKRIKINNQEKLDLIKGYEEGVIPTLKKDAISRKEIKKRIKEKYEPVTKEGKEKMFISFLKDPRNKKISEIRYSKTFIKLESKMNALLEPYGGKIDHIYLEYPVTSSPKENHYNQ